MLKIITTLVLFLIGIAAQAQVSENRDLTAVSKIIVKGEIELVFAENAVPLLKVEARDKNSLQKVITKTKGNTLKISVKNAKQGTVKVYVSAPAVENFKAGSKAKITLKEPVNANQMEIILNSGAQFTGVTRSKTMKLYANYGTMYNGRSESNSFKGSFSNATVNLSGTSEYLSLNIDQASHVYAGNFIADYSNVSAENDSSIIMYAKKDVRMITDDSVTLTYFGSPEKVMLNNCRIANNNL